MIYKVVLNPSLNKTIEVEELIYDDVKIIKKDGVIKKLLFIYFK